MLLGSGEQSYGLDPAVLDAVQNGAGPDGMPLAPAPSYGLPPELVPALQNGFASPAPMPMAAAQPPIPAVESPTGIAPPIVDVTGRPIPSSTSRNTPAAAAGKPAAPSNEATIAKADAARAGEIENQAQITDQQGQVAAQEAQDVYAAKQTGLAAAEVKQKEADAKAAAWQQRVQTAAQNFDQATTNEANYKVDENRRWNNTSTGSKVLAGIGVLLAGVGGALTHQGGNAALQIIQDSIKEDVANQWKQKDALGRQIGYAKGRLDNYRQLAGDDAQAQQLQVASEYKKVADQIDLAASKYAAPQAKARAQLASSQLRAQAQQVIGNAAEQSTAREQRAQEMKNQTAQVGIAAGHLSLARKSLDEQIREHDLQRQDKLDELALNYAKLGDKDKAAAAKAQAASGVFDPTSGTAVLTPDGQAQMTKADELERAARSAPAAQQAALKQQAQQLRNDAEVNHGFQIEDKDTRREVVKSVGAGQKLIDTIDRINATLAGDPSSVDRSTWAGLETDFESAKADWIELHKGKPSSREFEAIGPMFGADPGSMTARVAGRGKMTAALTHLRQSAIADTSTDLRANGYKGTWQPRSIEADKPPELTGETGAEAGEAAKPGFITQHLMFKTPEQLQLEAENNSEVTSSGLSKKDDATVQSQIAKYAAASDKDREKIVGNLTAYASSDRPSVAGGVITLLRSAPEVYSQVVSRLPPEQQKNLAAFDASALDAPVGMLQKAARGGDQASASELIRRASAGDAAARAAVVELVQQKGRR